MKSCALALLACSLVLWPTWPIAWREALKTATQHAPIVTRPGGFLLLLAALRWKRPEARWLLATALVPGNPAAYDALPLLVLLPATVWLYWTGDNLWGTFMLIWTLFVGTLDNFLRPVLIRQGADLPLLLIFAGVIGGLLSMGLLGIFVGPVVLAVSYTLLEAWINEPPDAF